MTTMIEQRKDIVRDSEPIDHSKAFDVPLGFKITFKEFCYLIDQRLMEGRDTSTGERQ